MPALGLTGFRSVVREEHWALPKLDRTERETVFVKANLNLSVKFIVSHALRASPELDCTVGKVFTSQGVASSAVNSDTGVAALREWVYYKKEVAALRSHIPVRNDNQAERRGAL